MIKIDNIPELPLEVKQALAAMRQNQARFQPMLDQMSRNQAQLNQTLERANYYENIARINAMIAPAIEVANQYKAMVDSMTSAMPTFSSTTRSLLSDIETNVSRAISMDTFPDEIPSFQVNNQHFNNDIQKSVSAEIISNVHEEYQNSSKNEIDNSNTTNEKDEIAKHSNLRSDLSSKEWHSRLWVEAIYKFVISRVIILSAGAISEIDLINIFRSVIEYINSLK